MLFSTINQWIIAMHNSLNEFQNNYVKKLGKKWNILYDSIYIKLMYSNRSVVDWGFQDQEGWETGRGEGHEKTFGVIDMLIIWLWWVHGCTYTCQNISNCSSLCQLYSQRALFKEKRKKTFKSTSKIMLSWNPPCGSEWPQTQWIIPLITLSFLNLPFATISLTLFPMSSSPTPQNLHFRFSSLILILPPMSKVRNFFRVCSWSLLYAHMRSFWTIPPLLGPQPWIIPKSTLHDSSPPDPPVFTRFPLNISISSPI